MWALERREARAAVGVAEENEPRVTWCKTTDAAYQRVDVRVAVMIHASCGRQDRLYKPRLTARLGSVRCRPHACLSGLLTVRFSRVSSDRDKCLKSLDSPALAKNLLAK